MKTFARILAVIIVFVLFGAAALPAKEKKPMLPPRVLAANTVFVENRTTSAELLNKAYSEISKWGRLQLVDNAKKADIVLRLTNGNSVELVSADAKAEAPNGAGADEAVPPGSTRISVIDPKTGSALWSDIRKTDSSKAGTHMLDGLREAFDATK